MGKNDELEVHEFLGISREYLDKLVQVLTSEIGEDGREGRWTELMNNSVKRLDPKDANEALAIGWFVSQFYHDFQRKQKIKEILGEITKHIAEDEKPPKTGPLLPPLNLN